MRTMQTVIDVLVLISMLCIMYSGIVISRDVFTFLPKSNAIRTANLLHKTSSAWGFVLMGLHLGLHWNLFLLTACKKLPKTKLFVTALRILGVGIAVYGVIALSQWNLGRYLLLPFQMPNNPMEMRRPGGGFPMRGREETNTIEREAFTPENPDAYEQGPGEGRGHYPQAGENTDRQMRPQRNGQGEPPQGFRRNRGSKVATCLNDLAIWGLWVFLAHYFMKLLKLLKTSKKA